MVVVCLYFIVFWPHWLQCKLLTWLRQLLSPKNRNFPWKNIFTAWLGDYIDSGTRRWLYGAHLKSFTAANSNRKFQLGNNSTTDKSMKVEEKNKLVKHFTLSIQISALGLWMFCMFHLKTSLKFSPNIFKNSFSFPSENYSRKKWAFTRFFIFFISMYVPKYSSSFPGMLFSIVYMSSWNFVMQTLCYFPNECPFSFCSQDSTRIYRKIQLQCHSSSFLQIT
jgi:hypothetical protein